ncbi:MAG: hypothetical protein JNL39_02250 [Opitutaceae bacterium]|nr:hypothetical protein [Opitutaceae bacterium]
MRFWLGLFIAGLVLSGLTAFPLLAELNLLCALVGLRPDATATGHTGLAHWLLLVREGLANTYARYPFIGYGTDWLAFGHIVIALFFVAPWREPGRHLPVLRMGLVACALVIPLALIAGEVRGIPPYWRLLDCAFGVAGAVPLWIALRQAQRLPA